VNNVPAPTWKPTFAQIIVLIVVVLNTYLIASGHHELGTELTQASDRAAVVAAAAAAHECQAAMLSTPRPDYGPIVQPTIIPTEDNHPFANATEGHG